MKTKVVTAKKFSQRRIRRRTLFVGVNRGGRIKKIFVLLAIMVLTLVYQLGKWNCKNSRRQNRKIHYKVCDQRPPLCYHLPEEELEVEIPTLPGYEVPPNSIFFLETSCGHESGVNLTLRQACAFESAARAHPDSEVLVLFPSPISLDDPSPVVTVLLQYANLKFVRISMETYLNHTPLETFDYNKKLNESLWPESHGSDVLRLATLWKYGGTYLDSDFIVFRPLNAEKNFAGAESSAFINGAVLNVDTAGVGRQIVEEMLKEIREDFQPTDWGYNGPEMMSRVLFRICNETNLTKMNTSDCREFTVFPPPPESPFYPIPYEEWGKLFDENSDSSLMEKLEKCSGIHFWNNFSKDTRVRTDSRVPINLLAAKFCPRVHSIAVDFF